MFPSNELMRFSDGRLVSSTEDMKNRRSELIDILAKNAYGYIPPVYCKTTFETVKEYDSLSPNKADFSIIRINADTGNGLFSFPAVRIKNKIKEKSPTFILINFNSNIFDKYCPVEEILDNGFNIIQVYYNDITTDDGDFSNGLAAFYDRNSDFAPGKISLWSWALSRIIDVAVTLPETDTDNIAVIGHSRLGKTALWCGANDERIKYVISNDSGCMGAALNENKHDNAETIPLISERFPYWFCNKFNRDAENGTELEFDQHFLIAASAPRYVLVASAVDDLWADPASEYDSCRFASPGFEIYGINGLVSKDTEAEINKSYDNGHIGYHKRYGTHFLSREDWNFYMNFIKSKM